MTRQQTAAAKGALAFLGVVGLSVLFVLLCSIGGCAAPDDTNIVTGLAVVCLAAYGLSRAVSDVQQAWRRRKLRQGFAAFQRELEEIRPDSSAASSRLCGLTFRRHGGRWSRWRRRRCRERMNSSSATTRSATSGVDRLSGRRGWR